MKETCRICAVSGPAEPKPDSVFMADIGKPQKEIIAPHPDKEKEQPRVEPDTKPAPREPVPV